MIHIAKLDLFAGIPVANYAAALSGHAMHTLFVHDLDALVAQIADRGLNPAEQETYSNGVRKTTYRDADGNEIGFGGAPV
jgi:hypothetical protein